MWGMTRLWRLLMPLVTIGLGECSTSLKTGRWFKSSKDPQVSRFGICEPGSYARRYPREFIQTGPSAIDGMNALIRGQKLPICSSNGLPHDRLSAQIVRQSRLLEKKSEFSIVFAGMGIKNDVARFFVRNFED